MWKLYFILNIVSYCKSQLLKGLIQQNHINIDNLEGISFKKVADAETKTTKYEFQTGRGQY